MPTDSGMVPAPWKLTGDGYILLYRFSRKFLASQPTLSSQAWLDFAGGFGAVMIVNYRHSNVGPYKELLCIPGKFAFNKHKWYRISSIYVSTNQSVINGRENWGIPKLQGDFTFAELNAGRVLIDVYQHRSHFFNAILQPFGPSFPVSTALIPVPLMQPYKGRHLQTTISGTGRGRLAKLEDIWVDESYFPNIALNKPITVLAITNFTMVFPKAIPL